MKLKLRLGVILSAVFIALSANAQYEIYVDKQEGCAPLTVKFSINMPEGGSAKWNFGNGNSSTKATPSFTFNSLGSHPVYVDLSDASGNGLGRYSTEIDVKGASSSIQRSTSTVCLNEKVQFSLDYIPMNCVWKFDDGKSIEGLQATRSFSVSGSQNIIAIVKTECGTDTSRGTVNVRTAGIKGNFSIRQTPNSVVCPGSDIDFRADARNLNAPISKYTYYFGNGTTAYHRYQYNKKYAIPGEYTVKVKYENTCGSDTTISKVVSIDGDLSFQGAISTTISPKLDCSNRYYRVRLNSSDFKSILWNFGDGRTSTQTSNYYKYSAPGTYPITLNVTDYCGNDSIVRDTIVVSDTLPWNTTVQINNPTDICPGRSVRFNSAYSGYTNYHWNFGNGDSIVNGNYYRYVTFDTAGTYNVRLTVTDYCGKDSTINKSVTVLGGIHASSGISYYINPKQVSCPGDVIRFQARGNNLKSASWKLANVEDVNSISFNYRFENTGVYPIELTTTNYCGLDTIYNDTVRVLDNDIEIPNNAFNININDNKCPQTNILFYIAPNNSNPLYTYTWIFGDGEQATTTENNTYHAYAKPGNYKTQVIITNGCGNTKSYVYTTQVNGHESEAYALADESPICPYVTKEFYLNYGNEVNSVTWDFGGGIVKKGRSVYHSYSSEGNHKIKATVYTNCGKEFELDLIQVVSGSLTLDDMAAPDIKQTILAGDQAVFRHNSDLLNISSIEWDFGDDYVVNSWDEVEYFKYEMPGIYEVKCTYHSYCGVAKSFTNTVTVKSAIEISDKLIEISKNPACPGDVVEFSVNDNSGLKNYTWTMEDGAMCYNPRFKYSFDSEGTYKVQVQLYDFYGNDTIIEAHIKITKTVPAESIVLQNQDFTHNAGELINLNLASNHESISWDLGDGNMSNSHDLVYTYTSDGEYDVSVTAGNACKNSDNAKFRLILAEGSPVYESVEINGNNNYCLAEEVVLTATAGFDSYIWNMADGNVITTKTNVITHTYESNGSYTVWVTVVGECEKELTDRYRIRIGYKSDRPDINVPPVVCLNSKIKLELPEETFVNANWYMGDGTSYSGTSVTHTYTTPGSYSIYVSAGNKCGYYNSDYAEIIVKNNRLVGDTEFTTPASGCKGQEHMFYANTDAKVTWDFGDGNFKEGNPVVHAYNFDGDYKIKALLESSCSVNAETFVRSVEVNSTGGTGKKSGTVNMSIPKTTCAGDKVLFSATASDKGKCSINYGDGSSETFNIYSTSVANFEHKYASPGLYDMSYTIVFDCGTPVSGIRAIQVFDCPEKIIDNPNSSLALLNTSGKGICVNSEVVMSAEGGYKHTWDFGDGSSEETYQSGRSEIVHRYAAEGEYTVSVLMERICGSNETKTRNVRIKCNYDYNSTDNINLSDAIELYPNPASDMLSVVIHSQMNENASLIVLNPVGQVVLQQTVMTKEVQLNISDLSSGIYFVKYNDGNDNTFVRRFIKN